MTDESSSPPPGDTRRQAAGAHRAAAFSATHWSVVLAAGQGHSPEAHAALARLCERYWYPLYAFVRREGYGADEAQDLTQEFFARLLARDDLAQVRPEKGRFRSFLLASLKHFLVNEWKRAHRLKRGGGQVHLPLEGADAERRFAAEPAHNLTPERLFERRWALTLLEHTLNRLREEQAAAGRSEHFDTLKTTLTGEGGGPSYATLAHQLGLSEPAVKMAVHRLRKRYRALLREEIAHTVGSPAEVDDELRGLFEALSCQ